MSYFGPSEGRFGLGWGIETAAAAASADFTPASAPNLQFWVRSDTGVSGASAVSAWGDLSGNARNLSQATTTPLLVSAAVNGFNAIRFDGTNDFLRTATTFTIKTPFTVFIVLKPLTVVNNDFIFRATSSAAGPNQPALRQITGPGVAIDGDVAGPSVSAATSAFALYTCIMSSANSTIAKNADADVSSAGGPSVSGSGFLLGSHDGVSNFASFDCAEVAFYSGQVSGATMASAKQYFIDRYAL